MSSLSQQLVLKEGDIFILSQDDGEISGNTGLGLYYHDVRYLSRMVMMVNGQALSRLESSGSRTFMGIVYLANEAFTLPDGTAVPPETITARRSRFISDGLHERIELTNYNRFPVPVTLTL